ncbi:MAG: putative sulfate exporter family transporter, partial [Xanthobacteraceae bacterium]
VPWFIIGFLLLLALRSFGLVPQALLPPITRAASLMTTIAMAGLGLGVDIRVVARTGPRVTLAVTLSLIVLGLMSYGLIRLTGMA